MDPDTCAVITNVACTTHDVAPELRVVVALIALGAGQLARDTTVVAAPMGAQVLPYLASDVSVPLTVSIVGHTAPATATISIPAAVGTCTIGTRVYDTGR